MLKYIIVGTGRCGTRYISRLLTFTGNICGHEHIFGFRESDDLNIMRIKDNLEKYDNLVGESSWLAVPYLSLIPNECTIIHLIRNPLEVISSFNTLGTFNEPLDKYGQYAYKHLPELRDYEGIMKSVLWYVRWNEKIEEYNEKDNYHLIKLDDIPQLQLNDLKIPFINAYKMNNLKDKVDITMDDIPNCELKNELIGMMRKYGY